MARVTVLYFASLRDAAGTASETIDSGAADLRALYEALRERHGFALPVDRLRVAVDDAFAHWDDALVEGSEIVFVPPVSGGGAPPACRVSRCRRNRSRSTRCPRRGEMRAPGRTRVARARGATTP